MLVRNAKGSGMGLFGQEFIRTRKLPYRFEMQDDRLTFFMSYPKVAPRLGEKGVT